MVAVNESELSRIDRLGLAYCRLTNWEWDELFGPKPEGFDDMPNYQTCKRRIFPFFKEKRVQTKSDCVQPMIKGILSIIGEANANRCWCVYGLGMTEEEWFRWYTSADRWPPKES